jgi:CRP-like cAMP-binding protein
MKLKSANKRSFRQPPLGESAITDTAEIETLDYPHTARFLAGRLRHELSGEDLDYLESMIGDVAELGDREVLSHRAQRIDRAALLLDGFMFRTIQKDDNRSIVGICVPGDFVNLHGFALRRLDHNVVAAGKARVAFVDHELIEQALVERPTLARALWFASLLDAAIHRTWIKMLEQHDAPRRIAHIFCELHTRLGFVGRASEQAVRTPFTQFDLADMCGISAVHANRAVGKLREVELAEIRRGTLYPRDWEGLLRYAQFDPAYLFGSDS